MIILGIESSCDESAVALVNHEGQILAHQIHSQIEAHQAYGGVVPEIASRQHVQILPKLVETTLAQAGLDLQNIDGFAATAGPGLLGGLMIGTLMAKSIAMAQGKPYLAVNHLEAHALTPRLSHSLSFPYLLLLVSGGHSQIIWVESLGNYQLLATTIDDAAGEAFDKTAKIMGLGFPGGPAVESFAKEGKNPHRFTLPMPLIDRHRGKNNKSKNKDGITADKTDTASPHFSFSGLKTAVKRHVEGFQCLASAKQGEIIYDRQDCADLCLCFEQTMTKIIENRLERAIKDLSLRGKLSSKNKSHPALVIAGGVGANQRLRHALKTLAKNHDMDFIAPPITLCTDNAAMVAWAAMERFYHTQKSDGFDFRPRPRWPLEDLTPPLLEKRIVSP